MTAASVAFLTPDCTEVTCFKILPFSRKMRTLRRMIMKGKMRLERSQTSTFLMPEVAGRLPETEMKRAERTMRLVMLTVMMASRWSR